MPISGAMSTTLTLVVTQSSATMSPPLPITGLVRPVGVGEVIFCRPSFTPKSYLELSLLTESTAPYPAPRTITTTTTPAPSSGCL